MIVRFQLNRDKISGVITDVVMPKMGGVEMFRKIRQFDPDMPTLFVTGYDRNSICLDEHEQHHTGVILKPVQIPEFSKLVHDILKV